jgi:hypothetical protein
LEPWLGNHNGCREVLDSAKVLLLIGESPAAIFIIYILDICKKHGLESNLGSNPTISGSDNSSHFDFDIPASNLLIDEKTEDYTFDK